MTPYVSLLMPELQKALLDPLPEVRATAARAMGSLLKGMGPAALGDLLPWLLTTLRSEGSSVERSGAAQVSHSSSGGGGDNNECWSESFIVAYYVRQCHRCYRPSSCHSDVSCDRMLCCDVVDLFPGSC